MGKKNCWEYHRCGREPYGERVADLGVCPAALDPTLDGVHDGKMAGRACWVVVGTLCQGEVQGSLAAKFGRCESCPFYATVKEEEGTQFRLSAVLLGMLRRARRGK